MDKLSQGQLILQEQHEHLLGIAQYHMILTLVCVVLSVVAAFGVASVWNKVDG